MNPTELNLYLEALNEIKKNTLVENSGVNYEGRVSIATKNIAELVSYIKYNKINGLIAKSRIQHQKN